MEAFGPLFFYIYLKCWMSSNLFCSHIHVGEVRVFNAGSKPCCKLKRSNETKGLSLEEYRKYLSDKLNAGIRATDCNDCWIKEASGIKSYRQNGSNLVTPLERQKLKNDPSFTLPVRFLEVILSNVCNFACQMCGPHLSTKWQSLLKTKDIFKSKYYKILHDKNIKERSAFVSDEELKNLKYLKLMGGEPFLAKETFELLERVDRLGIAHKIKLISPTNCSIFPNPRTVEILKTFKSVTINTSFDGVEELNDYIRVGSDWNKCIKNFQKWIDLRDTYSKKFTVYISCTVTILNVNKLSKIFKFFSNYLPPHQIGINPTTYPIHLSIANLKKEDIKSSLEKAKQSLPNFQEIYKSLDKRELNYEEKIKLKEHLVSMKTLTGKTLQEVNPQMSEIVSRITMGF